MVIVADFLDVGCHARLAGQSDNYWCCMHNQYFYFELQQLRSLTLDPSIDQIGSQHCMLLCIIIIVGRLYK